MTKRRPGLEKILPLTIILISILLYLNTLPNTFVYDDAYVITENYFIKSWGNLPKLFTKDYLPFSGELSYRPIVTLTYFFDYAIWRQNPLGYHLTNVILHHQDDRHDKCNKCRTGVLGIVSSFEFIVSSCIGEFDF